MPVLSNNDRLRQIAEALDELGAKVMFVGGAVIQLYSTDQGSANPMTTYDVDCVVDISSYSEYRSFEKELFEKHFSNDASEGAPICRYLFNGEKVDFMPKVDTGIGQSNRWYPMGMKYRQSYRLDNRRTIYIMPAPIYIATKLEALHSRGGADYRGEKDFEDIVYVLNSCGSFLDDLHSLKEPEILAYLKEEFTSMLNRRNLREEIECSLMEGERVETVIERMKSIAEI